MMFLDALESDNLMETLYRIHVECTYRYGKGRYYIRITNTEPSIKYIGFADVTFAIYDCNGNLLDYISLPVNGLFDAQPL